MTPDQIQIQTGRMYSKHGQRIIAQLYGDEIVFNDLDRFIDGAIPIVRPPQDRFQFRDMVMFGYDNNQYRHPNPEQTAHIRSIEWIDHSPKTLPL